MCVGSVNKPASLQDTFKTPETPKLPGAFAFLDLERTGAGDLMGRANQLTPQIVNKPSIDPTKDTRQKKAPKTLGTPGGPMSGINRGPLIG